MNDAENLSRLLGHLPPALFREFIRDEFDVVMPAAEPRESRRRQRSAMDAALTTLEVADQRKMEELAERIVLLSDGLGQDVVDGLRNDIRGDAGRKAFDEIRNQYERALWLHRNHPDLFEEALNSREADLFRQSGACYSGFKAPRWLRITEPCDEDHPAAVPLPPRQHAGRGARPRNGQARGLA